MNKITKIAQIIWNHARKYFKKEIPIVDEVIETVNEITNEVKNDHQSRRRDPITGRFTKQKTQMD